MIGLYVLTLAVPAKRDRCLLLMCPEEDLTRQDSCRMVPIQVTMTEGANLGIAIESSHLEEATTHELFMNALTNLDTTILKTEIVALEEGHFRTRLYLRCGERVVDMDASLSDAVSLAIRQNASIFIDEQVFEEVMVPYSREDDEELNEIESFRGFLQNLQPEDFIRAA